jgi:hypothetical protein
MYILKFSLIISINFYVAFASGGEDRGGGGLAHQFFTDAASTVIKESKNNATIRELLRHNTIDITKLEKAALPDRIRVSKFPLIDSLGNAVDALVINENNENYITIQQEKWEDHLDHGRDVRPLVLKELLRAAEYNNGNQAALIANQIYRILSSSQAHTYSSLGYIYYNSCTKVEVRIESKKRLFFNFRYCSMADDEVYPYNPATSRFEQSFPEFNAVKIVSLEGESVIIRETSPTHDQSNSYLLRNITNASCYQTHRGEQICENDLIIINYYRGNEHVGEVRGFEFISRQNSMEEPSLVTVEYIDKFNHFLQTRNLYENTMHKVSKSPNDCIGSVCAGQMVEYYHPLTRRVENSKVIGLSTIINKFVVADSSNRLISIELDAIREVGNCTTNSNTCVGD